MPEAKELGPLERRTRQEAGMPVEPRREKQRFLVETHLHGQKAVKEIDLAVCLTHLPLDCSKASFVVKRLPEEVDSQAHPSPVTVAKKQTTEGEVKKERNVNEK
jgi:hypothetical protein